MNTYTCYFYYDDGYCGEIITWERPCFTHDMYKMIWDSLLWDEFDPGRQHYLKAEIAMGDFTYMFYRDFDGTRVVYRISFTDLK